MAGQEEADKIKDLTGEIAKIRVGGASSIDEDIAKQKEIAKILTQIAALTAGAAPAAARDIPRAGGVPLAQAAAAPAAPVAPAALATPATPVMQGLKAAAPSGAPAPNWLSSGQAGGETEDPWRQRNKRYTTPSSSYGSVGSGNSGALQGLQSSLLLY